MSGGSTPQQVTQTTTPQLTPQATTLFNLAYPSIAKFAAEPPKAYGGETVAGFTPAQTAGQSALLGGAETAGGVADWAKSGVTGLPSTLSSDIAGTTPFARTPLETSSNIFSDPGIWNPDFNAGTAAAIEAAQRPLYQRLTDTILPNVRSTAMGAGPAGSSRQGIAEGIAARGTQQSAADVAAKIVEDLYGANLGAVNQRYATNIGAQNQRYGTDVGAETARYGTDIGAANQRYGTNINAALAAYGMAPSLEAQALTPGAITSAVGEAQQAQRQNEINAAVAKYNYEQWAPFLTSSQIMSMAQGFPTGATSTGNMPQTSNVQSALGGALSGGMAGASLGSIIPGVGPMVGGGVGALGGAVLPFLFR